MNDDISVLIVEWLLGTIYILHLQYYAVNNNSNNNNNINMNHKNCNFLDCDLIHLSSFYRTVQ